jgi:hypothetical protein
MTPAEQEQILTLLQNIEENKKLIPTYSDLKNHPVFGTNFALMDAPQQAEVKALINAYVEKRISTFHKTKG